METVHRSLPTAHYTVAIAGSTDRSRVCASSIFADDRFKLVGVITPTPKPVGRDQIVEPNALHTFAVAHEKPLVIVEDKIDAEFQGRLQRVIERPDILLVVDFGYIIKPWFLSWPKIAPINVHPSDLPKYRGSSPGQFAIAFGEHESAVSIMVMDEAMDHGPILGRLPFVIEPTWMAADYYQHAFSLVRTHLTEVLSASIQSQMANAQPQPDESPTPTARMLKRDDGFVPFGTLLSLISDPLPDYHLPVEPIPFSSSYNLQPTPSHLYNVWRAFHPWPGLWTKITIKGQEKRMKLLELRMEGEKLFLDKVQLEGKTAQVFSIMLLQS